MMTHRINEHPGKVKLCKDGKNCTRQKCWYKHGTNTPNENNTREEESNSSTSENETEDVWVNNELDSQKLDFQQAPKPPTPPTKPTKEVESTN